eukprot:gene10731-11916_t
MDFYETVSFTDMRKYGTAPPVRATMPSVDLADCWKKASRDLKTNARATVQFLSEHARIEAEAGLKDADRLVVKLLELHRTGVVEWPAMIDHLSYYAQLVLAAFASHPMHADISEVCRGFFKCTCHMWSREDVAAHYARV